MKPSEAEEKITQMFTVRGRPVGYQASRWGGALVAVERGEFPISHTGFRSLCGLSAERVTAEFLEELSRNHEREKKDLIERLREAQKPTADRILNYIHVSGAYEQAIQYGFYASDQDRTALWAGAHQLLCRAVADSRFQPAPDPSYVAWKAEHCDGAVARAREFKTLLARLAAGQFPAEMPMRLLGANSYLALPAKPGGEPKIDLGGYTAEMALDLPSATITLQRTLRPSPSPRDKPEAPPSDSTQLGLFDSSPREPTVRTVPSATRGMRPSL